MAGLGQLLHAADAVVQLHQLARLGHQGHGLGLTQGDASALDELGQAVAVEGHVGQFGQQRRGDFPATPGLGAMLQDDIPGHLRRRQDRLGLGTAGDRARNLIAHQQRSRCPLHIGAQIDWPACRILHTAGTPAPADHLGGGVVLGRQLPVGKFTCGVVTLHPHPVDAVDLVSGFTVHVRPLITVIGHEVMNLRPLSDFAPRSRASTALNFITLVWTCWSGQVRGCWLLMPRVYIYP